MHEIACFVEDSAHEKFLSTLIHRLADEIGVTVKLEWRSARRGHGAVVRELRQFLRNPQLGSGHLPDLVVVATDANCKGLSDRRKEITEVASNVSVAASARCAGCPVRDSLGSFGKTPDVAYHFGQDCGRVWRGES